jgi:hypothetical protein
VTAQDCRQVLWQRQAHNSAPLLDVCSPSTSCAQQVMVEDI